MFTFIYIDRSGYAEDPRCEQDIALNELNQSAKESEGREKTKKGVGTTPGD